MKAIGDDKKIERLVRKLDGSVYAYRCLGCGAAWKIYQHETHSVGCVVDPPKEEECDGSNTCEATEHVHGCYQSKREER